MEEAFRVLHISRFVAGAAILVALVAPVAGQDRRFFRKPVTAMDFWKAMQFEIEVGEFDVATRYLKEFADKVTDQELVGIEEKEGMSAFFALRTLPEVLKDPKAQREN